LEQRYHINRRTTSTAVASEEVSVSPSDSIPGRLISPGKLLSFGPSIKKRGGLTRAWRSTRTLAKNAIRSFALGRQNWLFADTVKGAKASAMLYGIGQTAKAIGLEPYVNLRGMLERLPYAQRVADFEALPLFAQPTPAPQYRSRSIAYGRRIQPT
jgi:hypothetical protein